MPFRVHLLKSQKSVAFGSSECIAQTDVWPGWEFFEATLVAEVRGEIHAGTQLEAASGDEAVAEVQVGIPEELLAGAVYQRHVHEDMGITGGQETRMFQTQLVKAEFIAQCNLELMVTASQQVVHFHGYSDCIALGSHVPKAPSIFCEPLKNPREASSEAPRRA